MCKPSTITHKEALEKNSSIGFNFYPFARQCQIGALSNFSLQNKKRNKSN